MSLRSAVEGPRRGALPLPGPYLEVLKPRETLLLALMGLCAGVLAHGGLPPLSRLGLLALALLAGCGGANGLTNYLDREVDARMRRTRHRPYPSGRLSPRRGLAWSAGLALAGLALAGALNPLAVVPGLVGLASALVLRKTWATHFLGMVASCAPVWVGWLALNPRPSAPLWALTLLTALWVPLHIWNLMEVYREDYRRAGVSLFPLDRWPGLVARSSPVLALGLVLASVALGNWADLGPLYLVPAVGAGLALLASALAYTVTGRRRLAYRTFRLSAYPYLGVVFLASALAVLARGG